MREDVELDDIVFDEWGWDGIDESFGVRTSNYMRRHIAYTNKMKAVLAPVLDGMRHYYRHKQG